MHFFIRANNSKTLFTQAVDTENWKACTINFQDIEVTIFNLKNTPTESISFALPTKQDKYLH